MPIDIRAYNRLAWNKEVEGGQNQWTQPVSPEVIAAARRGEWEIILTPTKVVPRAWMGEIGGKEILCLASGGGQQGPVLAAAGGRVTVFDNSPRQLEQDRKVAEREGLDLRTVEGDMRDLSAFPDERFDLVINPVSTVFVPEVRPVWREVQRVLKTGGALLTGFANPTYYLFDEFVIEEYGLLQVRHRLPYSDLTSLTEEELQQVLETGRPLEFGHTLTDLIGGQVEAGLLIAGFYEDTFPEAVLSPYMDCFIATRAIKP